MDFGEKLKALRLANEMTLEEVGKVCGVGKSTVRKWESGDIANMRRDKIALVAKALRVPPSYLMGWTDEKFEIKMPEKKNKERDEFVKLFSALSKENRKRILDLMRVLAEGQAQKDDHLD